jgi:hypothetical protein
MHGCAGARAQTSKGLLGEDHSTLWFEALEALPPPTHSVAPKNVQGSDLDVVEVKTKVAEGLMAAEASAFERRMSKANPADAHWLQTVRVRVNITSEGTESFSITMRTLSASFKSPTHAMHA